MAQQRVLFENEITNIITSWDTDDELSSDKKNAETPLGSSNSSFAWTTFLASIDEQKKSNQIFIILAVLRRNV